MVDQSEFVSIYEQLPVLVSLQLTIRKAWRMLTRSHMSTESNKDLIAYTPMLHSRLFTETAKFRDHHFQPTKGSLSSHPTSTSENPPVDAYLDGNPSCDRPLFVQFCANSPDELLDAARYVEPYCDAVDLNLGCPQGIARRGNYGAFLQEDWNLIYRLVNKLHVHLDIPVTAKIRILESKEKTLKYAKMILSAGASILTVHGRNRDQKGHKTGLADWTVLRYLRENLPSDTVIFANGNVLCHDDIEKCLAETGADGVMSAEGNLYDPTIFAKPPAIGEEGREYWRGRDGRGGFRVDAVFRRYMDILYKYVLEKEPPERKPLFIPSDLDTGDHSASSEPVACQDQDEPPAKRQKQNRQRQRPTSPNLIAMQAHLFHLLRPLVTKHTNIRDALAKCHSGDIPAYENVLRLTEAAVKEGLQDYTSNPTNYEDSQPSSTENTEETVNNEESSLATIRACKWPWWVCQPHVRPLPKEALEKGSLTMSKKDRKKLENDGALQKAKGESGRPSEREKMDQRDGMDEQEMPKEAMVCG